MLDLLTGWQDNGHFEKSVFSRFEKLLLNWNTRLYALLYMGAVICFAANIRRFTPVEAGLLVVCSSLLGGICFAAAHELLHAKENIDQFLQRIVTSFLFYPHYKVIHIRSHHVQVGTTEDENTAWFNESIYAYIYRTIPGSAARSWHLEAKRYAAGGSVFRNKMVHFALGQVAILLAFFFLTGPWGLLFYMAQIVGSHIVLESTGELHPAPYGLMRKEQGGEYEKTGAEHSWDTYHFFSSYVSFRVGHHSYHHLAVKPLLSAGSGKPQAPKLPAGYFWAIAMGAASATVAPGELNPKLKAVS